ncbi:hypothetical protein Tcan_00149 [Toxocara canis]|uniref:Secreted protein n=1 Tax=Toxocara canis TaxID=6265 RepID=A0A0B2V5L1_TOXCA|nr:hypothetical protein Tcan_00149 [Toxocara canis]
MQPRRVRCAWACALCLSLLRLLGSFSIHSILKCYAKIVQESKISDRPPKCGKLSLTFTFDNPQNSSTLSDVSLHNLNLKIGHIRHLYGEQISIRRAKQAAPQYCLPYSPRSSLVNKHHRRRTNRSRSCESRYPRKSAPTVDPFATPHTSAERKHPISCLHALAAELPMFMCRQ